MMSASTASHFLSPFTLQSCGLASAGRRLQHGPLDHESIDGGHMSVARRQRRPRSAARRAKSAGGSIESTLAHPVEETLISMRRSCFWKAQVTKADNHISIDILHPCGRNLSYGWARAS